MNGYNISFKSNINIVSNRAFKKVINDKDSVLTAGVRALKENCSVRTDLFRTEEVRTCTAGGIRSENGNFTGFHILDDESNKKDIKKIYDSTVKKNDKNYDRALLIGSKWFGDFESYKSVAIFDRLYELMQNAGKKVTVFRMFTDNSAQANLHYDAKKDTWTINIQKYDFDTHKYKSVLTKKELKDSFQNISIAPGDNLFINNKKIKSL